MNQCLGIKPVIRRLLHLSVKVGPRLVVSCSGQENTSHHLRLCFPSNMAAVALLFAALTSQECLCVVRRVRRRVGVKFTTAATQV